MCHVYITKNRCLKLYVFHKNLALKLNKNALEDLTLASLGIFRYNFVEKPHDCRLFPGAIFCRKIPFFLCAGA